MKKLLPILTICILAGCASVSRQVFKARQTFDKYPNEAAKYCGDKFPVADSILTMHTDSSKGRATDYTPALVNLKNLLDSAKAILSLKQSALANIADQLDFTKEQLQKAGKIIGSLNNQINALKTHYKPCGVDTITRTYTELRTNTAKLTALTVQIAEEANDKEELQKKLQDIQTQSAHRLYILIGIFLLIAIYVAFKIYIRFTGTGLITGIFR